MNAGSPCGDGGKPNNFALPCSRKSRATTIRTTLSISGAYFSTRSGFIDGSRDSEVDRTNLSKDLWFPAGINDHGSLNRRETSGYRFQFHAGSNARVTPAKATVGGARMLSKKNPIIPMRRIW